MNRHAVSTVSLDKHGTCGHLAFRVDCQNWMQALGAAQLEVQF